MLLSSQSGLAYMTKIEEKVIDKIDLKSKSVVANGKKYVYAYNLDQSSYSFEQDAKTRIDIRDINEGESYYLEIKVADQNSRSNNEDVIIFISKSLPSE